MARRRRLLAVTLSAALVLGAVGAYLPAAETVTADETASSSEDMNLVNTLTGYYTFDNTLANSASDTEATASLHGGAGDTWNEDATGTASYNSDDAISGSAYEFSGNSNMEILSSTTTDWWGENCDTGQDYALTDGDTLTFTVECTADVSDYAAFSVELYDATGNYLTTGSDGNVWFAGEASGTVSGVFSTLASTIISGTTYTVTVNRSGNEFTVTYYDVTNSATFATLVGTSSVDFDDTVNVHFMAQVGTFDITYSTTDATSGEGLELDVTTSEEFTISMWVNTYQKLNYQPIFLTIYSSSYYVTAGTYYNDYASGGIANYNDVWSWLDKNTNCSSTLTDLPKNTWTYVTLTMTSDGVATLYYNGEVLSTQTISGYDSSYYTGMPIYLGINWWNESFCGLMDEVTVYSSALTADEVYTLYSYDGDPNEAAEAEESGELATSISHVSVHDPSIVKGYVEESVTELTSTTEIVGEADDTHTKGVYFIFGSHLAFAYSWDLMNWTTFTNNITTDYETLFADEAEWSANGSSSYDLSGNMWAPDVIWVSDYDNGDGTTGAWCMYMSINGDNWYSTICMLTSDSLYGDWTYVGMVIQSGNYKYASTGATFDYYLATGETEDDNNLDRYTANRNGNLTYEDNCIDPCVTYDEDGNLWMTYGSWFGGIWMIKLDASTGLRDYDTTYDYEEDVSDPYQGYKLAQGYHSSGEASYIEYIDGYYYLFVTYGSLTAAGGYNMRVYRSDEITGPYTDESGDTAIYSSYQNNVSSTLGMRLMSYYKWSYQTYAQVAQGHNSVYYDEDTDQIYLVYHTRTNDGTEGHTVRVHQLYVNEDGWLVTAPFEYAGETTTNADLESTSYDATDIAGSYEVLLQAQSIDYEDLEYVEPVYITLGSDGTISGDLEGTWSMTDGKSYITLTTGTDTYKGVVLTETMEGKAKTTITFTAVGTSTETAIWGYQYSGTDAIEMEAEALTLPAQTVNGTALDLITTGTYGTTITWASSNESVIATDGTVTVPTSDTTVTLTATIAYGDDSETYRYEVKVIGTESIDEDGNITVWTSSDTYDLTDAVQGTYSFANFFNATVGTAGLTLYNGVSIEFTAERTGDYNYLSNILGFNVDGDNSANIMYFTGGSYLGFNAASEYFDANADTTNWVTGTDYIGSDGAVTIKIVILPSTYEVYVDGELAYSMDTVASGETSGTNGTIDTIYSVLTYLNSTATEFDLGWGSWWDGGFAGTISNITLIALAEEEVDTCGYAYYANYSNAGGELSDWTAPDDSTNLGISNDGDSYGNYVEFAVNTGTNSRGAYTTALSDAGVSSNYTVEADIQLTNGNNQTSEFAIMASDYAWTSSSYNNGIASGYILKLQATAAGATTYYVNDDTDTTVTIPAATWVHISVYVAEDGETVTATISYDGAEDQTVTTEVNGGSELAGMYVRRGRYYGRFCVDNIKVYQTPTITFLGGSLWMDTSDYTATALRFGYTIDLGSVGMEGVVDEGDEDDDQPTWTWTWSVDGETYGGTLDGENYIDNGDGTITTNLVITDIPSSYYSTNINSTLTFTYCLGGETITITDDMQTRSVEQVATAIQDNSDDDDEIAYAKEILAVIGE